jgi:hypothetical protein
MHPIVTNINKLKGIRKKGKKARYIKIEHFVSVQKNYLRKKNIDEIKRYLPRTHFHTKI